MRQRAGKATTDQLRNDIDQGRTGDKVRFPDPAAAPLGTDDEAAGHGPGTETVAEVRRDERAKGDRTRPDAPQLRIWLTLAAAIALIVAAAWAALG